MCDPPLAVIVGVFCNVVGDLILIGVRDIASGVCCCVKDDVI